jgi:hypothetical protein
LNSLTSAEGETLLKVTRHIFPHDTLEDAVYALVVRDLDAASELLSDGVKELNQRAGGHWAGLDTSEQFRHVEAMSKTPFFEKIRTTAVVSLYNNELAFAHFGYEGAAGDGGYLHAGFDDLDWLPAPEPKDSGMNPS